MTLADPQSGDPVRPGKVLCIGRNYARHAAEMNSPIPSEPVVFLKPSTALVESGGTILLPRQSSDVHHEVELVAWIGVGGKHIPTERALEHVAGYAVGLDMTARDIQARAKQAGTPWSVAKGFDTFAPVGAFAPASAVPDPQDLEIRLRVNGDVQQDGRTRRMLFSVAELVSYCSSIFTLEPGDLLFTGTPEGVGPVFSGDVLEAEIPGLPPLRVDVRRAG